MKVVWSWLLELCELERDVSPEEGARVLTDLGLEVESIERTSSGAAGLVVAEVAWKKPHPNADRLTLVGVRRAAGGEVTEVVCGATNVPEAGGRVIWAPPGATLPGGVTLGEKTLKGVVSAGMLCAEDELGLSDDHAGIIVLDPAEPAEVGADAGPVLGLDLTVFDVGVPANRGDCLGHLGVARELCAGVGGRVAPWTPNAAAGVSGEAGDLVSVEVRDPGGCPRYIARVIDGLTVRPSPHWLRSRLRAVGVRPQSNLVDVTNYVMFELGQPLHAFDFSMVRGGRIVVQRAGDGGYRTMTTLDGVERALEPDDLLICDAEGPVALAGVMGGLDSEVQVSTTRVLLESACFEPTGIRRTARRVNLHSEASHRFGHGVDVAAAERVSQRAAQLLAELGGGRVLSGAVDVYPDPAAPVRTSMRVSRASMLTGVTFTRDEAISSLERLELAARADDTDADRVLVQVPSHRSDLAREVDLVEELIRLRGYDSVPATLPRTTAAPAASDDARGLVREALRCAGLSEAITFGFTSPGRIEALRLSQDDGRSRPVKLANPMSVEQSVMRTSLLCNLLGAVSRNRKYGVTDVGLFEIGTVFLPGPDGDHREPLSIAAVLCGRRPGWLSPGAEVDFFDLKGALSEVAAALDLPLELRARRDVAFLHPGVAAEIALADQVVGVIGEVHPETRAAYEIDAPTFAMELSLGEHLRAPLRRMHPIPKHPAVARDLSFFVDIGVPAQTVRQAIDDAGEALVERVQILEDFRDPEYVPAGKKGMLWSITYRAPDRTLTDREVDAVHEPLVERLLADLSADRR